jgi:hypothetical protein
MTTRDDDDRDGAAQRERITRPRLARTRPLRSMASIGRFDEPPPGQPGPANAGRPLVSPKDVIEHGLRVAQEVIDQQIGASERILRHLRQAPVSRSRAGALDSRGMASMTERSMVLTRELAVLGLEMMETMVEAPTAMRAIARIAGVDLAGAASGAAAAAAPRADAAATLRGAVQIASPLPAKGEVTLFPGAVLDEPVIDGLFCADAPRIEKVAYLAQHRAFRVVIDASQPPGVYSGVILARDGHTPLGTLVVTLFGE